MNRPLPKSVQRDLAISEAYDASFNAPPATPEPVIEIPAASPEPVAPPPAPEPPPPAQPQGRGDAYWEQRLRTVQGMNDATVRNLAAEVQALKAAVTAKPPPEPPRPTVDPKDIDAFGADMIEMVNKQAERVHAALSKNISALAESLDARMTAIEERFTGVTQQAAVSREEAFYAALAVSVPDWETVNADPAWLEWLAEVDPVYGTARQTSLSQAHSAFDAQRAVAIFKAFKASRPKPRPAESLATQVAPANSGAPTLPAAPAAKRIWTGAEVSKFYNDQAQGKYRLRQAEADRMEAEIAQAGAEGRIR